MSKQAASLLNDLANYLSSNDRKICPWQAVAQLLELQLKKYTGVDV